MRHQFDLPGISCEQCKGSLALHIEATGVKISILKIQCKQCGWEEDILEKGNETYEAGKKRVNETYEAGKKRAKEAAKEIALTLLKLKDNLPKDRKEWGQIVTNSKHPITYALLTGLVILLMDSSGFGVYMGVAWILSNLILNPVGFVLIPLTVAIGFYFRSYFKREKLDKLKVKLTELEHQRDLGEISQEEFETRKNKLFTEFFD